MDIPSITQTTAEGNESNAPQGPASPNITGAFLTVPTQDYVANTTKAVSNGSAPNSAGSAPDIAATNVNPGDDVDTTVDCKEQVIRVTDDMTFLQHQLYVLRGQLKYQHIVIPRLEAQVHLLQQNNRMSLPLPGLSSPHHPVSPGLSLVHSIPASPASAASPGYASTVFFSQGYGYVNPY